MIRLLSSIKKYFERLLRRLRRATKIESRSVSDVFVNPQRAVVTLRERALRIEVRLRDVPVFLRRYSGRLTLILSGLIILGGTFGYIVSLRASVAHFYPASCLGNWDLVQNALGKPDLDPGAAPSDFTSRNSAMFTRGTAQIFCGNFQADGITLDELHAQEFDGADLTISWNEWLAGLGTGTGEPTSTPGGGAPAPASSTASTTELSSSTSSSTPTDQTISPESPAAPQENPPSGTLPAESTTPTSLINEVAAPTTTSIEVPSSSEASSSAPTAPASDTQPSAPTSTASSTTSQDNRAALSGWLSYLVPTAWAEPTTDDSSTPVSGTPDIPPLLDAPLVATSGPSTPEEIVIPAPTPATSSTGTSSAPSSVNDSSSTTSASSTDDRLAKPPVPTLVIPSFPTSTPNSASTTTESSTPATSTEEDHLEVRYSTDNENWHVLDAIPWGAPLSGTLHLPITSWDELEHLQVSVRAVRAGEPDRTILLDGFSLAVQYRNPAEEPQDPNLLNQPLTDQKDWPLIEHPHFRFRYRSQQGPLLQFLSSVTGLGKYQITKATIVGPGDLVVPIDPSITYDAGTDWTLDIPTSPHDLRPGRYVLRLEITEGGQTYIDTKEFYWGVLAVNINKSVIPLGETAYIQMAALNSFGRTICDAILRLRVTDPLGGVEDVPVDRSGQCMGDNVVDVPDYFANYSPAMAGPHHLTLDSLDNQGNVLHEISDDFQVSENAPTIEIERVGPTRIFPPAPYTIHLKVTAHADFNGSITDRAPTDFIITERDIGSIVTYSDYQTKTWQVNMAAGETKDLWYQFQAPNASPFLYLLGPASASGTIIGPAPTSTPTSTPLSATSTTPTSTEPVATSSPSSSLPVATTTTIPYFFEEARAWQIAADNPGDAWYDTNYLYRKELTIDHNQVGSSSGNLSNFPVAVSFTDSILESTSTNGHVNDPNGYDIIFTDSASSSPAKLSHEVESYVSSTGQLIAWVKIPTLATSTNTQFYVYYGNPNVTSSQESITSTWDGSYRGVWHLKETGCSTAWCKKDSTSYANNGSPYAGYTLTDISTSTGIVDGAIWSPTNGTQYVNALTSSLPLGQASITLEAWAYYTAAPTTPTNQNIIEMDDETGCAVQLGFRSGNTLAWTWGGGTIVATSGYPAINTWHHFAFTYNSTTVSSSRINTLYIDGVRQATSTTVHQNCAPSRMRLDTEQWTENFGGVIDEGRVSVIPRSAGWILTEYNNIAKQGIGSGKFLSTSSAEELVGGDVNPNQIHYHFRYDNGSEANASSATGGTEDTALTSMSLSTTTRLRLEVYNTGSTGTINSYRIEFANATSGPWFPVGLPASSGTNPWLMYDSSNLTDGFSTTNIPTSTGGVTDASANFLSTNYGQKDTSNQVATTTISSSTFIEMEFSMQPTVNVTSSSYYFRVTNAGTALKTYTRYPRVDLASQLRQIHYRWRYDDGSETSSSWAAAQDTPITYIDKQSTRRLRYEISNYGAPAGSELYRLEVSGPNPTSCAAAAYVRVASSSDWRMATSSNFADGDPTTDIAGGLTDENTTFVAGDMKESSDQASSTVLVGDQFTEMEYSVQATASSTGGANYCFRLTNGGATSTFAYQAYAQASIIPPIDATVSSLGTSTAVMYVPSTNQYTGGTFAVRETSVGAKTVTSITLTQGGTANGSTDVSNIKLFYQMDTSTTPDCSTKSYDGTQPQYGSTSASFSSANGTSTFTGSVIITPTTTMCFYVVLDVNSSAPNNSTLDMNINSPASDIIIASGTVGPGTLISPASSTVLIRPPNLVQVHYRWRNDDGNEKGFAGTGQDGAVSISSQKTIDSSVLGSLRNGSSADGVITTVTSFGSSTGGLLVSVASTTGFAPGDEVILINMQGSSAANGNVGNYEFQALEKAGTSSLVFATSVANLYGASSSNLDMTGQDVFVERVPQWTSLAVNNGGTLTANPWNGTSTIGLVAFRSTGAVTISNGGAIKVDSLGYRGGTGSNTAAGGQNGESYDGYTGTGGASGSAGTSGGGAGSNSNVTSTGIRGGGGGGGGNNMGSGTDGGGGGGGGSYGAGGGGGGDGAAGNGGSGSTVIGTNGGGGAGNGGAGGNAGSAGTGTTGGPVGSGTRSGGGGGTNGNPAAGGGGGGLYGTTTLSKVYLGSAGGGGGGDVGSSGGAINGQNGAGIIMAYAGSITNNAGATGVSAKGADGIAPNNGQGGGGGGAGGTIMLSGSSISLGSGSIPATGGASTIGFATGNEGGGAGGGGGGRIRLQSSVISGSSTTPTASTTTTPLGTTATWALAEDAQLSNIVQGTKERLRFTLQNAGGQTATSTNYRIQFATSTGGPWTDMPTSIGTSPWVMVTSTFFNNWDRTYNLNPGMSNPASSSFRLGYAMNTTNTTPVIDIDGGAFVELEYAIVATSFATSSNTYYFRLAASGAKYGITYNVYGQAGVSSPPSLSNIKANNNSDINLTEGTTTVIYVTATGTSQNGYQNLDYATATLYRTSLGPNCTSNQNNCYQIASSYCSLTLCSGNDCLVNCGTFVQFFAEPTDIGTYASDTWSGAVTLYNKQGSTAFGTSSPVELLTLLGLRVTPQINYGTMGVNTSTHAVDQTTTITNTGNTIINFNIHGTDMTYAPRSSTITVDNQLYASSSFNYDGCAICRALSSTDVLFPAALPKATSTGSTPSTTIYWGLFVPLGTAGAAHQGMNYFSAVLGP